MGSEIKREMEMGKTPKASSGSKNMGITCVVSVWSRGLDDFTCTAMSSQRRLGFTAIGHVVVFSELTAVGMLQMLVVRLQTRSVVLLGFGGGWFVLRGGPI